MHELDRAICRFFLGLTQLVGAAIGIRFALSDQHQWPDVGSLRRDDLDDRGEQVSLATQLASVGDERSP